MASFEVLFNRNKDGDGIEEVEAEVEWTNALLKKAMKLLTNVNETITIKNWNACIFDKIA